MYSKTTFFGQLKNNRLAITLGDRHNDNFMIAEGGKPFGILVFLKGDILAITHQTLRCRKARAQLITIAHDWNFTEHRYIVMTYVGMACMPMQLWSPRGGEVPRTYIQLWPHIYIYIVMAHVLYGLYSYGRPSLQVSAGC